MEVHHDKENNVFYTIYQGERAELKYKVMDEKTLQYYSTYVPSAIRNQGVAARLADEALTYAKGKGYNVAPTCSYVQLYIERHSQYKEIVKE